RDARVEATTQVATYGYVRAHAQLDGRPHQRVELLDRIGRLDGRRPVLQIIVVAQPKLAVAPARTASRLQLRHALEHGPWRDGAPERDTSSRPRASRRASTSPEASNAFTSDAKIRSPPRCA